MYFKKIRNAHKIENTEDYLELIADLLNKNGEARIVDIAEKLETIGGLGIKTFATVTYTVIDKKGMVKEIGDKVLPFFRN